MATITELITRAEAGEIQPLADHLRDLPMGMDFSKSMDGEPNNTDWSAVELAVMDGEMSEATYAKLRSSVGR